VNHWFTPTSLSDPVEHCFLELFFTSLIEQVSGYRGELAGLTAAILWAVASILYQQLGTSIKPLVLNLLKGLLACSLLGMMIVLLNLWPESQSQQAAIMLAISGVIGISIGDTLFFKALNNIGARQMLLLETLSPIMAAIIAAVAFGIVITGSQLFAMLITLIGVAWVITESSTKRFKFKLSGPAATGVAFGCGAAFCQALGAVIAHVAMTQSEMPSLVSAFIRMAVATGILLPWIVLFTRSKLMPSAQSLKLLIPAAFIGTFLCIWLQQEALKFTTPAIAQTLLALSPVAILPMLKWRGEIISGRAIIGALIATIGVSLLFIN
jgi:drug/metabolite transporter (DMT)-like permease